MPPHLALLTTTGLTPRLLSRFAALLAASLLVANSRAGNVYLVVGSDTAIWNDGSTVDVYSRHPFYPQDFYTDPSSPAYQVMDPAWRSHFKDSFGQSVKFTWWMMGGNIYRDADNQNVPVNNIMVLYLMKKYHGDAMRQFGDEISLHYHTFLWSDYNGDGQYYWNQSQTFAECRQDFDYTLSQYLLEENVFPVSFRSGWHYMDNDWQQYLDQLIPFSMHNNWPIYKPWYLFEPINNVQDWSHASSQFVPYHPATNDYQLPGTSQGWNLRSVKMQSLTPETMNALFALAAGGTDQVACIWNHLPESFVPNFARIASYAESAASNHTAVQFRYCTAIEGMQRWLGVFGQPPPVLQVFQTNHGDSVTLTIQTDKPLFQPRPFVALRDVFGNYTNLTGTCVASGINAWQITLPVSSNELAKVGIAATDLVGNLATRIIRYVPDDVYLDNLDPGYSEPQGTWTSTTNAAWGTDARLAELTAGNSAQARWTLPVYRSGPYSLAVQVPAITNPARYLSFGIYSGGHSVYATNFPASLPAHQWVSLGTPFLSQSLTSYVEMTADGARQPGTLALADVLRLTPLPLSPLTKNYLVIIPVPDGVRLLFAGVPGRQYLVQRSPTPGPDWTALETLVAPADGVLEYVDPHPPSAAAFYRFQSL